MDKNNLTIFCCYHNNSQLIPTDEQTWFYGPDGLLNEYLSEFSMYYYLWKNGLPNTDYVGVCHYRRQIFSSQFDSNKTTNDSCQVFEISIGGGIENLCKVANFMELWDDFQEYTINRYGQDNDFLKTDKKSCESNTLIRRATFFMTKENFNELCDHIFGFLDFWNKKYDLNYDSGKIFKYLFFNWYKKYYDGIIQWVKQQWKRILAYLFEFMVSNFIQTKMKSYYLI